MDATLFDTFERDIDQQGADAALGLLAESLAKQGNYHELFDARLMAARRRLGLSVLDSPPLDELPADTREKLEEAYLSACREVGGLLLRSGRVREAWMYLRPVGETARVADELAKLEPDDENVEQIIEVALNEGVAPKLGIELVLKHYGTCNAITTYEQSMHGRPAKSQREAADVLVRHLHRELSENLKRDIERQEGSLPTEQTIRELVADRDWLFTENNYHVDTSHLNSVIRYSIACNDPETLRLAVDMTEYGRRLSPQFQYQGEEPFTDSYLHYGLFLKALLGEDVEQSLAHFRNRADEVDQSEQGTAAAETYVALLARLGREREALAESVRLIPPEARTFGFAPSLQQLARRSGAYDALMAAARDRGDVLSFAAGLVEKKTDAK